MYEKNILHIKGKNLLQYLYNFYNFQNFLLKLIFI